ncbi:MAG: alpha-amylase, partial [Prevotellaceae bacterium]|nr:alpha-amylase [Prevotellaceae bacterium]
YDQKLKVLTRNEKLSDDITLRFSNPSWDGYPLTADKYVGWINETLRENQVANIWLNYDALGTINRAETGIFDFFRAIPYFAMEHKLQFMTPSEMAKSFTPSDKLLAPHPISWAGEEKNLSSWTGNDLQQEALSKLYQVTERVCLCPDAQLKRDWLYIQTIDHFRYMSHKDSWGSYYGSPYEAFINYMNILSDFLNRVDAQYPTAIENEELNELLKTINHQEKEIARLEEELKKAKSRKKAE